MKKGHIYISGPITGRPSLNLAAFRDAAEQIKSFGLIPVVPHDLVEGIDHEGWEWVDYMRICIKKLVECEAIITLHDWEESPGAIVEVDLARKLNMEVFTIVNLDRLIQTADRYATEHVES